MIQKAKEIIESGRLGQVLAVHGTCWLYKPDEYFDVQWRREKGAGILLISEDLDEILALADRVDVMYEGRIVGSFDAATADVHEIGLLMTGGGTDEEAAALDPADALDLGPAVGADPDDADLEPPAS